MKGNPAVLDTLHALLADELAAHDQYFAHAHLLRRWGYHRLADRLAHEAQDERLHADTLVHRLLFLGGRPTMERSALTIGQSVREIFELDLAVERRVRENLNRAIAVCDAAHDAGTREALMPLLRDTEVDHIDWLETQLGLIDALGLARYLQQQLPSR